MQILAREQLSKERGATRLPALAVISLGCPKNQLDLELMLGASLRSVARITKNLEEADVILVNSCSFLESAVEETLEEVKSAVFMKKFGRAKRVIVSGCFPAYLKMLGLIHSENRHVSETDLGNLPLPLHKFNLSILSEVDAFVSPSEAFRVSELVSEWFVTYEREGEAEHERFGDKRVLTTPESLAYVKVGEGCNQKCAFCLIPSFRGSFVSRQKSEILNEVVSLIEAGVKEIVLVSQDTTSYGLDIGTNLHELLRDIGNIPGRFWLRVMYLYPAKVDDTLIDVYSEFKGKILPYFDLPIQHISDRVLKRMKRAESERFIRRLFEKIRARIPESIINSNVIVGFAGETEEDFKKLVGFVSEGNIDRLGVFTYSNMPGMQSYQLEDQVPEQVKEERKRILMEIQKNISLKKNQMLVGKTEEVLVDFKRRVNGKLRYVGRTYRDAYEVNGTVIFEGKEGIRPGTFQPVKITRAFAYDLVGIWKIRD